MRFGKAQLSNLRLSESGFSHTIHAQLGSGACCRILRHPALTRMNRNDPSHPKSGLIDKYTCHKSILLSTLSLVLDSHYLIYCKLSLECSESFEERREKANGMLHIVGPGGLSDGVHREHCATNIDGA